VSDEADGPAAWARAEVALRLLAVDPEGLGGMWLRARASPVRDRLAGGLGLLPLPLRRLHPSIGDDALFGGVDLAATLGAGRVVARAGILVQPAALVLSMAERCPPALAGRLAVAMDAGVQCLIALDEGAEPDETLPAALADRLAFHLDLGWLGWRDTAPLNEDAEELAQARARLPSITLPAGAEADLAGVAVQLGVASLRAPLFTLRAARAAAALAGHDTVTPDDLRIAVELVLAPRATRFPEAPQDSPEEDAPPEPPEAESPDQDDPGEDTLPDIPQEILLEAARALLPPDLLERMAQKPARGANGSGAGATRKGNRRGRPLTPRAGRLDGTARIDLVATLRAAAPWQPIRRQAALAAGKPDRRLFIEPDDIRLKRYEEKSDRLIIFAVDASGSAAFSRLAEAKGAVELLLADAYTRRDHVALVAFRGAGAELLLPATRSLVQTKRRLASLPGGGATPLAAGLRAGLEVAVQARARGMSPTLALLTDGRANIALSGQPNRAEAAADATTLARALRAASVPALVIDMGNRPEPALRVLAVAMGAPYLALPRADAGRLSGAVAAALGD
jgi:magnesium chelatase subunit D